MHTYALRPVHGVKPVEIANFKGALAVTRDVALHADGYVRHVSVRPAGAKLFPERAAALAMEEAQGRNHTALLADGRVILFGHPRLFPNGPVITQMKADQETLTQRSLLGGKK